MALGGVTKTAGVASSATSITTASITLTSGKLYFLWASSNKATTPDIPTCSGWTQVATVTTDGLRRLTLFKKDGDGSTGTHTVNFTNTQTVLGAWVDEWTDAEPAATAVVQFKTAGNTTGTVTFDSNLSSESNAVCSGGYTNSTFITVGIETNFTLITRRQSSNTMSFATQFRIGSDSTPPNPDLNFESSPSCVLIGLEVKAVVLGPTISVQPASTTVVLSNGSSTTLTVTASGTGALHYQWKKNGSNVGTDSDELEITGIVIGDTGASYVVHVTDDNGTTISSAAILTVKNGPSTTVPAVSNSSGLTSCVQTSDYVNAIGEYNEIIVKHNGEEVARTSTITVTP